MLINELPDVREQDRVHGRSPAVTDPLEPDRQLLRRSAGQDGKILFVPLPGRGTFWHGLFLLDSIPYTV